MAQYNTVFHTLAKILPRHEIDRLDRKYGQGDKRRKTSRYVQFIVMLMAQTRGLKSLREIEQAQKSKQKRLYHLGVKSPVSRSALSRMNLVDAPQKWRILLCSSYQAMARLAMWIRIWLFGTRRCHWLERRETHDRSAYNSQKTHKDLAVVWG